VKTKKKKQIEDFYIFHNPEDKQFAWKMKVYYKLYAGLNINIKLKSSNLVEKGKIYILDPAKIHDAWKNKKFSIYMGRNRSRIC
jgi:hypothetical protein